jgi:transcriptional regulator with XRE-family HTH domain
VGLGERLREIRAMRGLQQQELAAKAGLTSSLISQVERDRLSPSIATLRKLALVLDVPVSRFFEEPPNGTITIVRRKEQASLRFDGSSEQWDVLASGLVRGKIRAVVATLGPKERAASGDTIVVNPGQMKLCYIIKGQVALHYGGASHVLHEGDSAYLDGGVDHRWENPGRTAAKALWVITE